MTFSVPDEIYKKMKEHPEIKWSQIARSALIKYIENIELAEEIISKSTLKIEDVEEMGGKIKRNAWDSHKKRMDEKSNV